ncbi:MFS transporter [Nocardioidaceae bacterium]|nr:MFS transporter [Nocardioidaceae bacterium]
MPVASLVLLVVAAVAVGFAAADTYVVVLALPDMMTTAGLSIDELQRAAPIVSGFLLGYVAVLPLVGRIADLRGRVPVLVGSLVVFAVGSAVTALAYDLPSMVVGRFFQGVGGGGLVPATLALVADLYPPGRRGLPLGLVSAVQELGAVVGPLFGAVVLAFSRWQTIFWINLAVGLVLAAAIRAMAVPSTAPVASSPTDGSRWRRDPLSWLLLAAVLAAWLLVLLQPPSLTSSVSLGLPFVPLVGESRWAAPLALGGLAALVLLLVRSALATRPLLPAADWWRTAREADLVGALWLAAALGGVVLAFASADPEEAVLSLAGLAWLVLAALGAVGLLVHLGRAERPLFPAGTFRARAAWGSLLVSLLVGVALIAALVDVPLFARVTMAGDSQLDAALVLMRLLIALPIGAVVGGLALRGVSAGVLTLTGMLMSAVGFLMMGQWGLETLQDFWLPTIALVLAGFGFGLSLAPINDALLAATDAASHGVASAFVVVARMVGMLVGISVLTTIGSRFYFRSVADLPPAAEVCAGGGTCAAYTDLLREASLVVQHTVFHGAAVAAILAGVLGLVLLRSSGRHAVEARSSTAEV